MTSAADVLAAIQDGFRAASEIINPAERLDAMNTLLTQISGGAQATVQAIQQHFDRLEVGADEATLARLSEEEQAAIRQVYEALGPLGRQIYDATIDAAREQAAAMNLSHHVPRGCHDPTLAEFDDAQALASEADDRYATLVDFAKADNRADFNDLARMAGCPVARLDGLWYGVRTRLNLPAERPPVQPLQDLPYDEDDDDDGHVETYWTEIPVSSGGPPIYFATPLPVDAIMLERFARTMLHVVFDPITAFTTAGMQRLRKGMRQARQAERRRLAEHRRRHPKAHRRPRTHKYR